ncbi:MAG TPA: protein kinase [Gemmatimonadales bacterium]|nr:protein kinase [Gemmatimonadales bacterium]
MIERLAAALGDRYRVERELGAGGMATVYLAEDLKHHRLVAVKVLRDEFAALLGAKRFLQEIETTARLQHPHILPLHDSGEANGLLFYVMPFVEGESLRDRIASEGALPINEAVRIASEVADALDYAHRRGVIHRDVKPENILLHEGRVLVADFGIALSVDTAGGRLTETGMAVGTPGYMSPEQAMGERELTARTDVYALGAVLYEMLTGAMPFTGSSSRAIVARLLTEPPLPPSRLRAGVLASLDSVVLKALQKDPVERFAGAEAFRRALAGDDRVPAVRLSRRRTLGAAGVAVGLVVVGMSVVLLRPNARLPSRAPDTTAVRLVRNAEFWAQKRTQEGCQKSSDDYSQATVLAPTYAAAWAGLANAKAFCGLFGTGNPSDGFATARIAAEKALSLDSGSFGAWTVLGMARLFSDQDWLVARRDLEHAAALDSTRYEPWLYRTWTFFATSQGDSALASIRHASRLAPTENIVGSRLGDVLAALGDFDGAQRALNEVLERNPEDVNAHQSMLIHALEAGDCRSATTLTKWFRRRRLMAPSAASQTYRYVAALEAETWATCGDVGAARRYADSVTAVGRTGTYVDALALALVYARLADTTGMFQSLESAVAQHNWGLWSLGLSGGTLGQPFLPYRETPHFQALLMRGHVRSSNP